MTWTIRGPGGERMEARTVGVSLRRATSKNKDKKRV